MNWISSQYARHWRNINLVLACIISLTLIFGPSVINNYVSQGILSSLYYPFFKLKGGYELLKMQAVDIVELRQTLMESSVRLSINEERVRENDRLRSALGFDPPATYKLFPTKIVSVSGVIIPSRAVVNRGESDSIEVNYSVINQQRLVGRVESVGPDYSAIQLLTDPGNRVAARVASSREMGIVKYSPRVGMSLDHFPRDGKVVVGDTIITSGLGGVYPPGLVVGKVTEVIRFEKEPFCKISIDPIVNFRSLEELFILMQERF